METPIIATGAAALGLYLYLKGRTAGGTALTDGDLTPPRIVEAWRHVEHAPNTWTEALYYFKEVCRYMYTETLGRWHTMDLFIGLAYLSHRETLEYPAIDIAMRGRPVCQDAATDLGALLAELKDVQRYLLYCRGLKFKLIHQQVAFWREHVQLDPSNVLAQQMNAGLLRPAYVLIADDHMRCVLLCIRGTQSTKDLFTSLGATTKPHHKVQANSVVLGYSHMGMLAAARWLMKQVTPTLRTAMAEHQGYRLSIVGHSMGAGTAALLTMMLREAVPECADARCYAMACPACMTIELAASCRDYVTSIVNGTDIVPTFSAATVDTLREDVTHSSWFVEFQRDLRTSVSRVVQGGMRGVGIASQWTALNILQPAAVPFMSCMTRVHTSEVEASAAAAAAGDSYRDETAPEQPAGSKRVQRSLSQDSDRGGPMGAHLLRRRLWPWSQGEGSGALGAAEAYCSDQVVDKGTGASSVASTGWMPDGSRRKGAVDATTASSSTYDGLAGNVGTAAARGGAVASTSRGTYFGGVLQGVSRWWWTRQAATGAVYATACAADVSEPLLPAFTASGNRGEDANGQAGMEGLPVTCKLDGAQAVVDAAPAAPAASVAACTEPLQRSPQQRLWRGMLFPEHVWGGLGARWRTSASMASCNLGGRESGCKEEEEEGEDDLPVRGLDGPRMIGDIEEEDLLLAGLAEEEKLHEGIVAVVQAMTQGGPEGADGEEEAEMDEDEREALVSQRPADEAIRSGGCGDSGRGDHGADNGARPSSCHFRPASPVLGGSSSGDRADAGPFDHLSCTLGGPTSAPKRHLYPAGRVLHLFPKKSVLGSTRMAPEESDAEDSAEAAGDGQHPARGEAQMLLEPFMPVPPGMRPTSSDIASARMAALQQPYMLMEVRDNTAYRRIKLCRTMVLDHMTPAYFTALDSVVRQLEIQLQVKTGTGGSMMSAAVAAAAEGAAPACADDTGCLLQMGPERGSSLRGAGGQVRARPAARPLVGPDGDLL